MAKKKEQLEIHSALNGELLTALPLPAFVVDAKGKVSQWNPSIAELLGKEAKDMLGKKAWSAFFKKRKFTPAEYCLSSEEYEQEEDFEVLTQEGATESFNFEANPVFDEDSKLTSVVCVLTPMAQNGSGTQDAMMQLPTPIMAIDREFNVTFMNEAGNQVLGLAADEAVGRKCYDLFKTEHCRSAECRCAQAMRSGQAETGETQAALDGGAIDIRYTGAPLRNAQGEITGAVEYVLDITKEKEDLKEAFFKNDILEKIPTPVMAIDPQYNVTFLNEAGAAAVGLSPATAIGKKCFDLFKTGDCNTENCRCKIAMATGRPSTGQTVAALPSGDSNIQYSGAPLRNSEGETIGALEYVLDINLQKEVQAQVETNVGTLRTLMEKMGEVAALLEERTSGIREQASSVGVGAEELSTTMEHLAENSKESEQDLASVAAATEEMTATVNEIASNAENARQVATNAVESVAQASNQVDELGRAAKEISQVTSTIVEIAEQTKLLALNATIEAARAGEAGKGFAVVASEVKELAKQTSAATSDIKEKIEAIQLSSSQTIQEIGAIKTVIMEVADHVNSIATATEEQSMTTAQIADDITRVNGRVQEVVTSVEQASQVSMQMTESISKVNDDVKEADQTTQRVSGFVNELEDMADTLTHSVGRFSEV